MHAGRLNIDGLKMSKSLKNFTTIKAVLEQFSARQMRIMFLRQAWDKTMMYTLGAMDEARQKERDYKIFLGNALSAVNELGVEGPQDWTDEDKAVAAKLAEARATIHASFCDNFNTPKAMLGLDTIVTAFNIYMDKGKAPRALIIRKAADYVSRILRLLGVMEDTDDLGFGVEGKLERAGRPYLNALAAFRDEVRAAAQKKQDISEVLNRVAEVAGEVPAEAAAYSAAFAAFRKEITDLTAANSAPGKILEACDKVRDVTLPALGVALEDRTNKPARWRLDKPEILLAELEERKAAAAEKAAGKSKVDPKKLKQRITMKTKDLEKLSKGTIPVAEYFKVGEFVGKYTEWDADGMPAKTVEGEVVSDKVKKKLSKAFEAHKKTVATLAEKGGATFLESLQKEIKADEKALEAAGDQ